MKRFLLLPVFMLLSLLCTASSFDQIIPKPVKVAAADGRLDFASCRIECDGVEAGVEAFAKDFASRLEAVSGRKGETALLHLSSDASIRPEGYRLEIGSRGVNLSAADYNGFVYGLQTMKQLLPAGIYGSVPVLDADWSLPCGVVEDYPFFGYRGALLDVSRHFFSVEQIKKHLDAMALCKMNRFHWHLTDDQGWRIEIKKYPVLTEKGAYRKGTQVGFDNNTCDGVRYGGYYTQQQIREVVEYAARLGIEVIPEIDLPGHMLAALSAFPQLGCRGGHYEMWHRWGISEDVLCAGKEETFEFLEDILSEVAELFPCEYIHIGGDECPKTRWRACPHCQKRIASLGFKDDEKATKEDYLQNYVMGRVQEFLESKGKKVIEWDEVLKGSPREGTIIMHWHYKRDCTSAPRRGYDVILVNSDHFYLDYGQLQDIANCPPSIARGRLERLVPFSKVYDFNPYNGLTPDQYKYVKGVQGNLWTEFIALPSHLEYMAMPRYFALCQVQWQDPAHPASYEWLKNTVMDHGFKVLDAMGFTYCTTIE